MLINDDLLLYVYVIMNVSISLNGSSSLVWGWDELPSRLDSIQYLLATAADSLS